MRKAYSGRRESLTMTEVLVEWGTGEVKLVLYHDHEREGIG